MCTPRYDITLDQFMRVALAPHGDVAHVGGTVTTPGLPDGL